MKLQIKKMHPDAVIPAYATPGAAGFDFVAIDDYTIDPGQTVIVKTGLAVSVPEGYELQVRPRSGVSAKTPLRIANAPGTVDSDFIGEIGIIVWNSADAGDMFGNGNSGHVQYIKKGDRIAQGVVCPVIQVTFEEVDTLSDTVRGDRGFGSTGV